MARASLRLGYGTRAVPFEFDPSRFQVIEPPQAGAALSDAEIERALRQPIASPPLREIVRPGESVVIVIPDATRAARIDRLAPPVVAQLHEAGVPDTRISFLIGAGIHRAATQAEIRTLLGSELPRRCAVEMHEARADDVIELGRTRRGTPIELNRRLLACDRTVVLGAISFHYFAGFSGGRKGVLPGCASERAIRANHLLAFDHEALGRAAGVGTGRLDGNPVHEDLLEAVAAAPPSFLANSVVGTGGALTGLYAGHWRDAHRQGCDEYARGHTVTLPERRTLAVVSAGGAPRDVNLIQAHKALEHAAALMKEGGTLVLLAECAHGLGRADFLDWFVPGGARATARRLVSRAYQVNGQTAWSLRTKAEIFRIRLVSSLDPATVRRMDLEPCASLAEALRDVGDQPGFIVPSGLTTLPVIQSS